MAELAASFRSGNGKYECLFLNTYKLGRLYIMMQPKFKFMELLRKRIFEKALGFFE